MDAAVHNLSVAASRQSAANFSCCFRWRLSAESRYADLLPLNRPRRIARDVENAALHASIQFPNPHQRAGGAATDFIGPLLHGHEPTKFFFNGQRRRRFAAAVFAGEDFAGDGGW